MIFAHDTEFALLTAAALVNTRTDDGHDSLLDQGSLEEFLDARKESGRRTGTTDELQAVIELRDRLQAFWSQLDTLAAAELVNSLLRQTEVKPQLTNHDGTGWHLHATDAHAPLAQRMGVEAAMAFADLIRGGAIDRLRRCDAPDCDAVLVDLSRNRSRRYCDTGNCGNRQHVAAYRARRATVLEATPG